MIDLTLVATSSYTVHLKVKFAQTLTKMMSLYGLALPVVFVNKFENFNALVSLDINILPLDCVAQTSFHGVLLIMTLSPLVFISWIVGVYFFQRQRILFATTDDADAKIVLNRLRGKCVYIIIIFMYTVFPLVSTTIFQTFSYDGSLQNGDEYLIVDYSIEKDDPTHQGYVQYAIFMCLVYCAGVPVASWALLAANKHHIQRFQAREAIIPKLEAQMKLVERSSLVMDPDQTDPEKVLQAELALQHLNELSNEVEVALKAQEAMKKECAMLIGLSPLYRDYTGDYWWFEVLQFCVTLFLVGVLPSLGAQTTMTVFLALVASFALYSAFANLHPYMNFSDDLLAQTSHMSLILVLSVGLVTLSRDQHDNALGFLLVAFVLLSLLLPCALVVAQFAIVVLPEHTEHVRLKLAKLKLIVHQVAERGFANCQSQESNAPGIELQTKGRTEDAIETFTI